MGIFSKIFKKKAEPIKVELVKATTDDKPATIPSEYAKTVVAKQKAASKAKPVAKPLKDAENKKTPVKKPVAKKAPAKAPAKKSTPKKK